MIKASRLISEGQTEEVWQYYCGFLDLDVSEFMRIQKRLLMEQLELLANCQMGQQLLRGRVPTTVEEFRRTFPTTTYADYAHFLESKSEEVLPAAVHCWAHTSGRSGTFKWIPFTERAYVRFAEHVLAAFLLSAARCRGEVRLRAGDKLVYNAPPPPYLSGITLEAVAEVFDFHFIPSVEQSRTMAFQEQVEVSFRTALVTGIDVLGSIGIILVKLGELFAEGARSSQTSLRPLHPKAFIRLARGLLRSRLAGRPMLPKDLWRVKAIIGGGTDLSVYRDRIAEYWGLVPHETYGSTEAGLLAVQSWTREHMTPLPDSAFLEFIPEEEWAHNRRDPSHVPSTVLLDELEAGKRYEVVITRFYGMPFTRYRMHDLIQVMALGDEAAGIQLPQIMCAGRTGDLIDLAGFSGLIDERMAWQAILDTGVRCEEWTLRKETDEAGAFLHLYAELRDECESADLAGRVHANLCTLSSSYADIDEILGIDPVRVTLLAAGTFAAYMRDREAAGVSMVQMKPRHINASDQAIRDLLRFSAAAHHGG